MQRNSAAAVQIKYLIYIQQVVNVSYDNRLAYK
jgi:hypothetical protein